MEAMLGFQEEIGAMDDQGPSLSEGFKLVPWLSWDEWEFVSDSIFSSSADKVASALARITTWRMRGCIPPAVDVTASIIEIQQKDGFIGRDKQPSDALYSQHLLQMLYCMAILRFVNCIIEKTRKKTAVSIAEAAEGFGIPRMLIDLRHEGSHRELPALLVLQDAAHKALDWLKSYYWEPQKKKIPFRIYGTADIRREIKLRLREFAFCLKVKQGSQFGSSLLKGKYSIHSKSIFGRGKLFSLMAGKVNSSKSGGSRKHIKKTLNRLGQLYSSFSSEVVSVLLELLLKALDSSNYVDGQDMQSLSDDWKPVITTFSDKEPDLLLNLLQAVLDKIETQECVKDGTGEHLASEHPMEASTIESLSFLFAWLVGHLKGLQQICQNDISKTNVSNAIPTEFLRKCLLFSATGNDQLMDSALQLSELMGGLVWKEKLKKLSSLRMSSTDITEGNSSLAIPEILVQEEKSICNAAKELEFVKLQRMKSKATKPKDVNMGNSDRWAKVRTWNPCPIGMLPRVIGSSGLFPVLDHRNGQKEVSDISKAEESWELRPCSRKREANYDTEQTDNSTLKKMRETVEHHESNGASGKKASGSVENHNSDPEDIRSGTTGQLMIGGTWKKVQKEEVLAIASAVKLLL